MVLFIKFSLFQMLSMVLAPDLGRGSVPIEEETSFPARTSRTNAPGEKETQSVIAFFMADPTPGRFCHPKGLEGGS